MISTANYTKAIVLNRTNYAEYDRIVTFLSQDYGKVSAIAKGVRKERSKLAGGIEFFCVSDIGFLTGHSGLSTLISSNLIKYYGHFLGNLNRVNFAYYCLKNINHITADATDEDYFWLVETILSALDDANLDLSIINVWWYVNLVKLTGYRINTVRPINSNVFSENQQYIFDIEHGGFMTSQDGHFNADHIKFLRLAETDQPRLLSKIKNGELLAAELIPYLQRFVEFVH